MTEDALVDMNLLNGYDSQYVKIGDLEVHYYAIGSGPPAILLHGLGGSAQDWSDNIPALSSACTIYALDLPGFGMSPPPTRAIDYSLEYAARLVRAFVDLLGLEPVLLVGNSMGGGISLKFAIDHPERLTGLVIGNAAGLGKEIPWSLRLLSLPGAARLALPFVSRRLVRQTWESMFVDPTHVTDARVEFTWQWIQRPEIKRSLARAYRNAATLCGQKDILLPQLEKISCPALILWGADDEVLPVSHAHRAQQLIADSSLHVFADCGHIPQIEQAAQFNQLVLQQMKAVLTL